MFQKNKISEPLICTRTGAYQGVRIISLLENFTYLLNERSIKKSLWIQLRLILAIVIYTFLRTTTLSRLFYLCSFNRCFLIQLEKEIGKEKK